MVEDFGFCSLFCKKIFGSIWGNQYHKDGQKNKPVWWQKSCNWDDESLSLFFIINHCFENIQPLHCFIFFRFIFHVCNCSTEEIQWLGNDVKYIRAQPKIQLHFWQPTAVKWPLEKNWNIHPQARTDLCFEQECLPQCGPGADNQLENNGGD